MLLARIAETSDQVRATSSRSAKVARLAECIRALEPAEVPAAIAFLAGDLRQRQTGVGWASLRTLPPPAASATLSVLGVDAAFARMADIAGPGAQAARRGELERLLALATGDEQRLLTGLIAGDLRQGAKLGTLIEAAARAADVSGEHLRRALMLRGDLGVVTHIALAEGSTGLAAVRLQPGRPFHPMLAASAPAIAPALAKLGRAAAEWKLDGARVQVHRSGGEVAVFTRTLEEITGRVPELIEAARALPAETVVLDGEAIALAANGRPLPFQTTSRRIGSRRQSEGLRAQIPMSLMLFDLLHLDGEDLLDRSSEERFDALSRLAPPHLVVPRIVPADAAQAERFLDEALDRGHEGIMLKALDLPYQAGRRGGGWLKVKRAHTLDLVVLAAEWGHGRRTGRLSNLHLGARDPAGGFVMLGKTFKGMTDAMLAWQTQRLLELETGRSGITVHVRPEQVVEVAFDGIQESSRYPGGLALRFARVKRYRTDKTAAAADSIETVRLLRQA